jgi:hypothetical protein
MLGVTNRSELIHEKDLADKKINIPQTDSIHEYFRKQEQEAL